MDFIRQYFVHYYEIGPSRRLTVQALLGYFEDIAILHSEARGLTLDWYEANHCGWMLIKWDVTIRELPRFGETVTLATRINGMKAFLADRVFTLTGADGRVLAEARSNWILMDLDKRRPMRVHQEQWERFGVSAESAARCVTIADVKGASKAGTDDGNRAAQGAAYAKEGLTIRSFTASNGDIDTNLHVNNLCFIEWALDSLSEDYLFGHAPTRISAQYRKELAHGAEARVETVSGAVTSVTATAGAAENASDSGEPTGAARTVHSVYSGESECCSIEIDWRKLHDNTED